MMSRGVDHSFSLSLLVVLAATLTALSDLLLFVLVVIENPFSCREHF